MTAEPIVVENGADATAAIRALRASSERLATLVRQDDERLTRLSYASEWTTCDVLAHLGGAAEISILLLNAGLAGEHAPNPEIFAPIWTRWNAHSPRQIAADYLSIDAHLVRRFESLDSGALAAFQLEIHGLSFDGRRLVRSRLTEHVLHTWDVAVMEDRTLPLPEDAVAEMVDEIEVVAARAGRAVGGPQRVRVVTTAPQRTFLLEVTDRVSVEADGSAVDTGSSVEMPAEAFVRLVYGRLDEAHTPREVATTAIEVEQLRAWFPGV